MATDKQKYELVFEAREAASKKIKELQKQLATLGGPKMVKSQREIKKLERQINSLAGTAKKNKGVFTRFTKGIAAGNIIANVATSAWRGLSKAIAAIGKATLVAAEVEELGNVLQFVGQRAGYTEEQITNYTLALRKSGIAQKETNQALLRAIQGNIKLADAQKLARIAQDAAVIGQTNSSEAFQTLIDAVVKGRVVLLKSLGIQGTFQRQYKELAETLGVTQTELTETQKQTARLNLVLKGGKVIAGAYETAMGSASKQLRSYDRLIQDLQVSVGQHLTPAMSVLVSELSLVTKEMTAAFDEGQGTGVSSIGTDIGIFAANVIFATKAIKNFGEIVWTTITTQILAPFEAAMTVGLAMSQAMSDPFSLDNWKIAGETMGNVFDGWTEGAASVVSDIEDIDMALLQYEQTVARLQAGPQVVTPDIPGAPAGGDDGGKDPVDATEENNKKIIRSSALAAHQIQLTAKVASEENAKMSHKMARQLAGSVNNMVGSMVSGRQGFAEAFKGIAQDFMTFFIQKALGMLIFTFIPGLKGILGNIFDTPSNDRMAAMQGRDFMQWFVKGALAEAGGGTELAVGISNSSRRFAPAMATQSRDVARSVASGPRSIAPVGRTRRGRDGGGDLVLNVKVSGNVMSDEFVEKTLGPKLEKVIRDGRSMLSLQNENKTGGRDVSFG